MYLFIKKIVKLFFLFIDAVSEFRRPSLFDKHNYYLGIDNFEMILS